MTAQQYRLLTFIDEYIGLKGYSPSYDELAAGMGLKSKSGMAGLLRGLSASGHVHYRKGARRSIVVLKPPTVRAVTRCPHCGADLSLQQ